MRHLLFAALYACGSDSSAPDDTCGSGTTRVLVSDYESSCVGTLKLDEGAPSLFCGAQLGGDPVLAFSDARSFLVARTTGSIFELDRCGRGINSFSARTAGDPVTVDPQDVAVLPDGSLLIPRFGVSTALVLNPSGALRATIDLSGLDEDKNPNMSAAAVVRLEGASKVVLVLERLDNSVSALPARQTSLLAVINPDTLALEQTIDLGVRNVFGPTFVQDESTLWLSAAGNFASATEADAGITRFDAATGTATLLVSETVLGGSTVQIAIEPVEHVCGAAIVADASAANRTSVLLFDARTGAVLATALGPTPGFDLVSLAWADSSTLIVGDRAQVSGSGFPVHVLARSGSCLVAPSDELFLPLPAIAF